MKTHPITPVLLCLLLVLSFAFSCKKDPPKALPTLNTSSLTNISPTTATCGGEISFDGNSPITSRGVCWGISHTPTIADSKTNDGNGTGVFASAITGLSPGTTYYIRAYATNSVGTSYGNQIIGTTHAVLPTVTTTATSNITASSFTCGGAITFDGGSAITARGVCWSITPTPTINDSKTNDGTGPSSFISSVTGLSPGTTYYIRAYATNSMGSGYGNQVSATTLAVAPTINTSLLNPTTETTASGGGEVASDGGSAVTSRGVCWSTNPNPTILNNRTLDGTGKGSFTSSLTGLTTNITYHVRAYATNAVGTSYGNENTIIINLNTPGPNVTDVDGNLYTSVKIGSQTWTVENLKATRYRNGSSIAHVTDGNTWKNLTTGAYCDFLNNPVNGTTYGHLYNFYSVTDERQLCPTGWHVPSHAEWTTLINFLGGEDVAGGKLKETGYQRWNIPNAGASNASGFTAVGGSWRGDDALFYYGVGYCGFYWSSSQFDNNNGWYLGLVENSKAAILRYGAYIRRAGGLSVRCVKD